MNLPTPNVEHTDEFGLLSDFCTARGDKFFLANGMFWLSRGIRFFSPWPSYKPISLSSADRAYLWRQGALFAHYVCLDDHPFFPGYDLIVDNKNYDFGAILSPKRRHNVRWALKHCSVERISFDSLLLAGRPLIEDTHNRQGRNFNESVLEMWKNYFKLAQSNPLFEAWGAFVSNRLAACCINLVVGDCVNIEMTFSRTDLLKYHPVDALAFVSTQNSIERNSINRVSYCRRPITGEVEGLVNFKVSMGFRKVSLRERVEINPLVKGLFSPPLYQLTGLLTKHLSSRSMYARIISGVMTVVKGQISSA